MKTIIAGSRTFNNYTEACSAVKKSGFFITEVVSGGAAGVDALGERYAVEHDIHFTIFDADWDIHGKAAGPKRNQQMADYADALVAIKDKKDSRGTDDMIRRAHAKGLRVFVYNAFLQ